MEEKKAGEKFPEYDKSDTVLSPKEQLLSAQKRSSNLWWRHAFYSILRCCV